MRGTQLGPRVALPELRSQQGLAERVASDSATNLPPVQTQRRGTRGEWQAISESTPVFNWFHIASRSGEATEETSQQAHSHLTFRHNMSPARTLTATLNVLLCVGMTGKKQSGTMTDS